MGTAALWYAGVTRYQWLVLAVASAGWVFDAFEGQLFNLTRGQMLPELLGPDATRTGDIRANGVQGPVGMRSAAGSLPTRAASPTSSASSDEMPATSTRTRVMIPPFPGCTVSRRGSSYTLGRRVTGMTVAPFVFSVPREASILTPNDEVAETIWAPVGPIARGETASTFEYEYGGKKYQYPSLLLGDRVVWGLTHRILQMLLEIVHGAPPT